MRPLQVLMKIVLPQAARVIVPPTSNQFIDMLKATSLVSVIGTGDLLTATQTIASGNFLVIELLLVASAWYLIMTTVAVVVQWLLERRLSRSVTSRGIVRS
jgi:polar amino acid transport system permease protein